MCKFRNSGQTCISANRFLVQDRVYDDFVSGFTEAVAALKVADGFTEGAQIGPLIDEPAVAKVERHVADALAQGADPPRRRQDGGAVLPAVGAHGCHDGHGHEL